MTGNVESATLTTQMSNWFGRTLSLLMQSVTPQVSQPPTGKEFAAIGIKSQTLSYPFDDSRDAIEFIQGTVTACLNARAQERGALILKVTGGNETQRRLIQRVIDRPNPVQSSYDFWETCSQFHDTTGSAAIFFVRGDGDLPAEMWIIPSYYVVALFDDPADPVPTAYRWADGRVITETENLCFIRMNSIKTAPYTGRGFLQEAIDSAMLYNLVVTSQKNWFASGGAPNVALVQPAGSILTASQIEDMQTMWNQKYNPATGISNIAVLPDGVTPQNFGPQEMNFLTSKEELRDTIREFLQTPKIILGDTDNVNLNNGQTALAIFDRTVVLRWAQKVASALTAYFQREYGDSIKVTVDKEFSETMSALQLAEPAAPGPDVETVPSKYKQQA